MFPTILTHSNNILCPSLADLDLGTSVIFGLEILMKLRLLSLRDSLRIEHLLVMAQRLISRLNIAVAGQLITWFWLMSHLRISGF